MRIAASQNYLSSIEKGHRDVTEKIIKIICFEFNINEEWLRDGTGEMFVQPTTFSLDEYARNNNLSGLEANIIKDYIELDPDMRKKLMDYFKMMFGGQAETAAAIEAKEIDDEVESYRRELEAEKKGATLSASGELNGKSV